MPQIVHTVRIARAPADVFAITNDIDNWRLLFNEYGESEVLQREDAGRFTKLIFRLRNNDGNAWQSWRLLDHQDLIAIAQRQDPLFPFTFMHLTWTYELDDGGGTVMTWRQDFELDPELPTPIAAVRARMDAHGRENQLRIKELIESGRVDHLLVKLRSS